MHDEANTHYEDQINNMLQGHKFLWEEFQVKPTIGWQIDPFGHSNANARLFAEMGFDAYFFGRIDWEDQWDRMDNGEMEWIQRPFFHSLGKQREIFAHCMIDLYTPPAGLLYDPLYNTFSDPWITDRYNEDFNAVEKTL